MRPAYATLAIAALVVGLFSALAFRADIVSFVRGWGSAGSEDARRTPTRPTADRSPPPPVQQAAKPEPVVPLLSDRVELTPVPHKPLPDFVISAINVEPKPQIVQGRTVLVRGREYTIRVEVTNQGPGTHSDPVSVSVDYGCQGPGVGLLGEMVSTGVRLDVGEKRLCTPYTFKLPTTVPHGTCTFRFKVNPRGYDEETDKTNNELTWVVTIH